MSLSEYNRFPFVVTVKAINKSKPLKKRVFGYKILLQKMCEIVNLVLIRFRHLLKRISIQWNISKTMKKNEINVKQRVVTIKYITFGIFVIKMLINI